MGRSLGPNVRRQRPEPRPLRKQPEISENYNKVIVSPHFRRPAYTRAVLSAISEADGSKDYEVVLCVEPGNRDVLSIIEDWAHPHKTVIKNRKRLGCDGNLRNSLDRGFEKSNYVIVIEDDVVISKDALRYFEWAREHYLEQKEVLSISGYIRSGVVSESQFSTVVRKNWFTPWGWATWSDRWRILRDNWVRRGDGVVWDSRLLQVFLKDTKFVEVYPLVARCQNIGSELGANVPSAAWHFNNQFNEIGAWSFPDCYTERWVEEL